jgi:hypothetical protein
MDSPRPATYIPCVAFTIPQDYMLFWKKKRAEPSPAERWFDLLTAIEKAGTDLMVVVGPEDGGSVCTDWVGAVVSISGADHTFPALVDALEDGLFHTGCRHTLIPYLPDDGEAEAIFCTKLALAAMTRRFQSRDEAHLAHGTPSDDADRANFTQLYDRARDAEKAREPQLALHFCQEALALLVQRNVFTADDQIMIARVLKGRLQTLLRAHQPDTVRPPAVE